MGGRAHTGTDMIELPRNWPCALFWGSGVGFVFFGAPPLQREERSGRDGLRRLLELYCADSHPSFMTLEEQAGKLVPTHDFQTPPDQPLEFFEETTYTGDPTVLKNQATREWIHSLSTILGALIDAGLMITMFREHEFACSRRDAGRLTVRPGETVAVSGDVRILVRASNGMWRLPDGHPRIPLSFSLRAKKH